MELQTQLVAALAGHVPAGGGGVPPATPVATPGVAAGGGGGVPPATPVATPVATPPPSEAAPTELWLRPCQRCGKTSYWREHCCLNPDCEATCLKF